MTSTPSTESSTPAAGRPVRRTHKPVQRFRGFVSLQSRGAINLPTELRKRMGLDAPGAQLELTEREDGVLEMRPMVAVPADQAWFWTPDWQAKEAEVDAAFGSGGVSDFEGPDDFVAHLVDLDRQATEAEDAQNAGGRG